MFGSKEAGKRGERRCRDRLISIALAYVRLMIDRICMASICGDRWSV